MKRSRVTGSGLGFGIAPPGRRKKRSSSSDDEGVRREMALGHLFSRQEVHRYGLMRRIEEAANFGLRYVLGDNCGRR